MPKTGGRVKFENPSPRINFGPTPLDEYLAEAGLTVPLGLRAELAAADLSALVANYDGCGRPPIHPALLLGLIVYGMLYRVWSLRGLEELAKRDVGAWWVCGGLHPDHSTIGAFVRRHEATLTEEFFVTLTGELCRKLKLAPGAAAGDGTVIEAAASHYRVLKAEALAQAAAAAPEQPELQAAAAVAVERLAAAKANGQEPGRVCLTPVEPEAVVQPLKNGANRPSYKPSVLANAARLIVGQHVHPSNEGAALPPMLKQHEALAGGPPTRILLDAGYHNQAVLTMCVDLDLDVLCPTGKADRGQWEKAAAGALFAKQAFRYDEDADVYRCPAGRELSRESAAVGPDGRHVQLYRGRHCATCPQRSACTKSAHGRTISRFDGDELKEALRLVMAQPPARAAYRQRKIMVEPVFAELRERQGLTRFHRRTLAGARVEFALHCLAYNLKRAQRLQALAGARFTAFFGLFAARGALWAASGLAIRLSRENGRVVALRLQRVG